MAEEIKTVESITAREKKLIGEHGYKRVQLTASPDSILFQHKYWRVGEIRVLKPIVLEKLREDFPDSTFVADDGQAATPAPAAPVEPPDPASARIAELKKKVTKTAEAT